VGDFTEGICRILWGPPGEPTVDDDRELFAAVESIYVSRAEQPTLGNLAFGLPPHLLSLLRLWIVDGQYGSVFNNEDDALLFGQFQAFGFQGMDELYPQVLKPLRRALKS
jgi:type IV secretory pathway VirB4 component